MLTCDEEVLQEAVWWCQAPWSMGGMEDSPEVCSVAIWRDLFAGGVKEKKSCS